MRAVRCGIGSAGVRVMGAGSAARFEAHLCGRALKLLSPLDAYAGGRRRAPCPLEGALRRGWRPTLGSAPGKSQNVPGSVVGEAVAPKVDRFGACNMNTAMEQGL